MEVENAKIKGKGKHKKRVKTENIRSTPPPEVINTNDNLPSAVVVEEAEGIAESTSASDIQHESTNPASELHVQAQDARSSKIDECISGSQNTNIEPYLSEKESATGLNADAELLSEDSGTCTAVAVAVKRSEQLHQDKDDVLLSSSGDRDDRQALSTEDLAGKELAVESPCENASPQVSECNTLKEEEIESTSCSRLEKVVDGLASSRDDEEEIPAEVVSGPIAIHTAEFVGGSSSVPREESPDPDRIEMDTNNTKEDEEVTETINRKVEIQKSLTRGSEVSLNVDEFLPKVPSKIYQVEAETPKSSTEDTGYVDERDNEDRQKESDILQTYTAGKTLAEIQREFKRELIKSCTQTELPSAPLITESDLRSTLLLECHQASLRTTNESYVELPVIKIKPFVTEFSKEKFSPVPPSRPLPNEKVPLRVNWTDLSKRFGLAGYDGLDNRTISTIEYYNMILKEDLLPAIPRQSKCSASTTAAAHPAPPRVPLLPSSSSHYSTLKKPTDSMKNLYSDASLINRSEQSPCLYTSCQPNNCQQKPCNCFPFPRQDHESLVLCDKCENYKKHLGNSNFVASENNSIDSSARQGVKSVGSTRFSKFRDKTRQMLSRAKFVLKSAFTPNKTASKKFEPSTTSGQLLTTLPPGASAVVSTSGQAMSQADESIVGDISRNARKVGQEVIPFVGTSTTAGGKRKLEDVAKNEWLNNYYETTSMDSIDEIEIFFQSLEEEEQRQKKAKKLAEFYFS